MRLNKPTVKLPRLKHEISGDPFEMGEKREVKQSWIPALHKPIELNEYFLIPTV